MNIISKKVLLDSGKNFYKGNMHCHTTISDGNFTPEQIKELYKSNGYSFVAYTDHEVTVNHSDLDDDDFLAITSQELTIKEMRNVSTGANKKMKVCHLNIYSKSQDNTLHIYYDPVLDKYSKGEFREKINKLGGDYVREYTPECINEIIRTANENGFFVCYNHPRWSLENYQQYSNYEGLWGVEILNNCCYSGGLYEYNINVYDDFLRDGKRIFASCGDDNHNSRDDSCGAFVMVNADNLTYDNIIEGLLKGNFYSSSGPEIYNLYVENGFVYIECSNAKHIHYSTEGRRVAFADADKNGYINSAKFQIDESDGYFRLDVIDEHGKRANTQGYFLDNF